MATIVQGNKEFMEMEGGAHIYYYVYKIGGRWTTGRESSYRYLKCPNCNRIIGTQFNAYTRHLKACAKKAEKALLTLKPGA